MIGRQLHTKLNDDEVVTGQRKLLRSQTGKEMEKLFWTVLSHLNKSSWKPERMKDSQLNYNSILLNVCPRKRIDLNVAHNILILNSLVA